MASSRLAFTALRSLAVVGALMLGDATPAGAITCSTNSTVRDPFYRGKATSDVYDNRFRQSHTIGISERGARMARREERAYREV
jgi:hypothetical protein